MTDIPSRKHCGLCEILNGPLKLKEERRSLCYPPWKDSGQLDDLYWVTVPAQNLFTWFTLWCFFMYIGSKQELEKRLSFSEGRTGHISTFHRNPLDRERELKKEYS